MRLISDGDSIHLGRVVVPKAHRKDGYGRDLVQTALDYCKEHFPNLPVHAQSQSYLQNFYASFGFEPISDVYLEDGIPHLDMIKKVTTTVVAFFSICEPNFLQMAFFVL